MSAAVFKPLYEPDMAYISDILRDPSNKFLPALVEQIKTNDPYLPSFTEVSKLFRRIAVYHSGMTQVELAYTQLPGYPGNTLQEELRFLEKLRVMNWFQRLLLSLLNKMVIQSSSDEEVLEEILTAIRDFRVPNLGRRP